MSVPLPDSRETSHQTPAGTCRPGARRRIPIAIFRSISSRRGSIHTRATGAPASTSDALVPAALFDSPPPEWRAQHHIYYDRRVMDVPDGLAKFRTNFGGEKCDDRGDSLPPAPD